jgi:syntaxin 18
MDRTAEFKILAKPQNEKPFPKEQKFYEELYRQLLEMSQKAAVPSSHKALLLLDKELLDFIKKSTVLLESIQIKGHPDIQANFEGIKFIINSKMAKVSKEIGMAKDRIMNAAVDLAPERPQYTNKNVIESENSLLYEQENKAILETTQYEATKQRLIKIEAVQRAIQENLLIQDERIDCVCISNASTSSLYETLLGDEDFYNGSFMKRSAFTILICLIFVLLFLHYYYRR